MLPSGGVDGKRGAVEAARQDERGAVGSDSAHALAEGDGDGLRAMLGEIHKRHRQAYRGVEIFAAVAPSHGDGPIGVARHGGLRRRDVAHADMHRAEVDHRALGDIGKGEAVGARAHPDGICKDVVRLVAVEHVAPPVVGWHRAAHGVAAQLRRAGRHFVASSLVIAGMLGGVASAASVDHLGGKRE